MQQSLTYKTNLPNNPRRTPNHPKPHAKTAPLYHAKRRLTPDNAPTPTPTPANAKPTRKTAYSATQSYIKLFL